MTRPGLAAGTVVTASANGQSLPLADLDQIPLELRGYVQIALDRKLLQAFFTLEQGPFDFQPTLKARFKPADSLSRAMLAFSLDNFRKRFAHPSAADLEARVQTGVT